MNQRIDYVHLESSTQCNARCPMCPNSSIRRKGSMEYDLFRTVVDQAIDIGCRAFTVFRAAEPLIFPDLFKWLDYLREKGARVSIYTNGAALTPEMSSRLKEYRDIFCDFTISFHGCDRESYERNTGLSFEKVRAKIAEFMREDPLSVNIYSLAENIHNPEYSRKFHELWDGHNFAHVGLARYMEWAGSITGYKTLKTFAAEGKIRIEPVPCLRVLHEVDVMYDGMVCLCCLDAHGEITFGNLRDRSLEEVLSHRLRLYYQEKHLALEFNELPLCKDCSTSYKVFPVKGVSA